MCEKNKEQKQKVRETDRRKRTQIRCRKGSSLNADLPFGFHFEAYNVEAVALDVRRVVVVVENAEGEMVE